MQVLIWVVDQVGPESDEGVKEPSILRRRHHPAPEDGEDRLGLIRQSSHDVDGFVAPNQGVVINKHVGHPEPLDSGDLRIEGAVGTGGI